MLTRQQYIEQFRNEFKRGIGDKYFYRLGDRGPNHYDCSTSIAYIFVKNGMLKRKDGSVISVQSFRNGEVNPAYLDSDPNFRVLGKDEPLMGGDAILIGPSDGPNHWLVISGIDEPDGRKHENWVRNKLMEVKGAVDGNSFAETWNKQNYKPLKLYKVARYKAWDNVTSEPKPEPKPKGFWQKVIDMLQAVIDFLKKNKPAE